VRRLCVHPVTDFRWSNLAVSEPRSLMPLTPDEIRGIEFDWFIRDSAGHLALVSTAGFGPVPTSVLAVSSEESSPIDHIEQLVEGGRVMGQPIIVGKGPGGCQEWWLLAERGIHVFDWSGDEYRRVLRPPRSVEVSALEDDLASRLAFVAVSFDLSNVDRLGVVGSRVVALPRLS